jgi:hypothetical protein
VSRWRRRVPGLLFIALLAGCSSVPPSPEPPGSWPVWAEVECERTGGVWRRVLNFCEYPEPGYPYR